MIIGTDVSLAICKVEGYLMVEYDGRKKFDRTEYYRVFRHYPEHIVDAAGQIMLDTYVCFDDLVETYNENKSDLDDFAETGAHIDFTTPTWHDLLFLADDIDGYMGLD